MAESVDSPRGRRLRPRSLDMSQIPAAYNIGKVASPTAEERSSDPFSPTIDSLDNDYRHVSPKPLPRHSLPTLPENSWLRNSSRSTSSGSKDGNSPRRYSYQSSNKRSSLSFPIQPDRGTVSARPVPVLSPTRTDAIASLSRSPSPTGSKFLTAVAAQERRVLELREELQKAEKELINLKKQFATHEALRKRNDPRRPQQLQNMETALSPESSDDDRSGSSRYMHREMEKRKAVLNGVRPHQRTVFSGSRHTRALSLLSPERTSAPLAFPRPSNQNTTEEPSKRSENGTSVTSPTLSMSPYDSDGSNERFRHDGINKDVIVRTGKQMASDLRQGLWTFLEDLRQATVGDEGISPTRARGSQTSLSNPKSRSPHRIGYHNQARKHLVTKSTPIDATFSAEARSDFKTATPNRASILASPVSENLRSKYPSAIPEHSLHDNDASNSPALPSSTSTAFSADSMSPTNAESSARTSMSSNPLDFIPAKPSQDSFDDLTVRPSAIKPRPTVLTHFETSFLSDVQRRASWPDRLRSSESAKDGPVTIQLTKLSLSPTMSFGGLLPGGAGIGGGGALGGGGMGDATAGMSPEQIQEQKMIKTMQSLMESCPVKTVISGGMGFALGGMFGLFMSSMRYDTPLTPAGAAITNLPVREQLRRGLKDMARSSYGSARNFGVVGAMFAGTECCIEGFRARNDLSNGVAAGCITGGVLAAKAGPQAAALGCAGFAAFSAAIDYYMRMPPDEGSMPIV